MYRFGIQLLSFNRPNYLRSTLASLITKIDTSLDKLCVIEQSDDSKLQQECLKICSEFENIHAIPLFKNMGQRGATNFLYSLKFWDDCEYVMLSDQDNLFHMPISIYSDYLNANPDIWITSGYNSPEHDIEDKVGEWVLKSSCRAGHMCMRYNDFKSLMPLDENHGSCAWYAGLDWSLTHWAKGTPGYTRDRFIACYPGGVEHIGRDSTWQGYYDDEYSLSEHAQIRNLSLYEIIQQYPPKHIHLKNEYWYEKISPEELLTKTANVAIDLTSFDENDISTYPPLDDDVNILAFNYFWPQYGLTFLEDSIRSIQPLADKYIIVINVKSHIGESCSIELIHQTLSILSKFGNFVTPLIYNGEHSEYCQSDNIGFYYSQFNKAYPDVAFLWLVQTDEIYTPSTIDTIHTAITTDAFKNKCVVFNPICYMDTPNWAVNPPEVFERPSLVYSDLLSSANNDIRKVSKLMSNIYFHHMSYVMSIDETKSKFSNWGHREHITQPNSYYNLLNNLKTDKALINLHPIFPEMYKSVQFVDKPFNNGLFINYLKFLLDHNKSKALAANLSRSYSQDLEQCNPNNFCALTNFDIELLTVIVMNLLPSQPMMVDFNSINCNTSILLKALTMGRITSVSDYEHSNSLFTAPTHDLQALYRQAIRKSLNYNFNLLNGDHKVLSCFTNDNLDFAFLNTPTPELLESSFIELWPKFKNGGIICGAFGNLPNIRAKLLELLSPHIHSCPWGHTNFNFYETYYDLSATIISKFSDLTATSSGIWFARISK